jgi:hypothetical protein
MITCADWMVLVGLLSVCAFVSYTVHEIGNAIADYLNQ